MSTHHAITDVSSEDLRTMYRAGAKGAAGAAMAAPIFSLASSCWTATGMMRQAGFIAHDEKAWLVRATRTLRGRVRIRKGIVSRFAFRVLLRRKKGLGSLPRFRNSKCGEFNMGRNFTVGD